MKYNLVLASRSPRRHELLRNSGLDFIVRLTDVDETPPAKMPVRRVAAFLAEKKANAVEKKKNEIVIAADTVVILKNRIFGKPENQIQAVKMLKSLSGKIHVVITGVCLLSNKRKIVFSEHTKVYFKKLTLAEINYYVKNFKLFDKAGSYAIQEWIGLTGIYKIEGDYFNVMGLPVCRLIEELKKF